MNNVDDKDYIKSHEEIIREIDKIREFEQKFTDFSSDFKINKKEKKEEIVEFSPKKIENITNFENKDKNKFSNKIKKYSFISKNNKKKVPKPATFNIGFNDNGNLVNYDFKKKKVANKSKFKITNLIKRKKPKDEKTSEEGEDSKVSKIKEKFGFFGKLKKFIPTKNKEKE